MIERIGLEFHLKVLDQVCEQNIKYWVKYPEMSLSSGVVSKLEQTEQTIQRNKVH